MELAGPEEMTEARLSHSCSGGSLATATDLFLVDFESVAVLHVELRSFVSIG
jgi:hypothetical protein